MLPFLFSFLFSYFSPFCCYCYWCCCLFVVVVYFVVVLVCLCFLIYFIVVVLCYYDSDQSNHNRRSLKHSDVNTIKIIKDGDVNDHGDYDDSDELPFVLREI